MSKPIHPIIYESKNFTVFIEDSSIGWILHCYVYNWSRSVYKEMIDTMVLVLEIAPRNELYAFSKNSKLTKFCELFGMQSIDTIKTDDGEGDLLCVTL